MKAMPGKEAREEYQKYFGDIPLKYAMLAWTPVYNSQIGVPGRMTIIPRRRTELIDFFKHFGVVNSVGACFTEWTEYTNEERLIKLFSEVWHAICRDGVSPEEAHNAMMVIPEYRDTLSGESFFKFGEWDKHING